MKPDFGHMIKHVCFCKKHKFSSQVTRLPCFPISNQWKLLLLLLPSSTTSLFRDIGCVDECSVCLFFGFHLPVTYDGNILLFAYLLSEYSSLGRYLFRFLAHVLTVFALYLSLSFMRSLCVLDTGPLSDTCFTNIFFS